MGKPIKVPVSWYEAPAGGENPVPFSGPDETNSDLQDSELLDAYSRAVIGVVGTVGPSVVSISIGKTSKTDEFEPVGAGSGFVIAPDGYIVTNCHVVQGAPKIEAA